jgi:two-component system nitrate/nitrite response regulator NarL
LEQTSYDVIAMGAIVGDIGKEQLDLAALVIVGVSASLDKTITTLRRLRLALPDAKLFMVAEGCDHCDCHQLLRNGADGCILDVTSQEVLVKSLDLALLQQRLIVFGHAGRINHPPAAAGAAERSATGANDGRGSPEASKLSDRERQILAHLSRGASNKAIARHCYITETTVKAHMKAILRKIAVRNRTQAAVWAIDHGLIDGEAGEDVPLTRPMSPVS